MSLQDISCPKKYSLIVRQEHIKKYDIARKIKDILPEASVFSVRETTRGAVETCLLAQQVIDLEDAIVVLDCDLEFHSREYSAFISNILKKSPDEVDGGALVSFDSRDPRYSYALADSNSRVIRTAEKTVISNHALAGAYFFSKSESFLRSAERLLRDLGHGRAEFYLSLLYNDLIRSGEYVYLAKADQYYSYGTPEELGRYRDEPGN